MVSNDHNKDEQERGKFQTNHNVLKTEHLIKIDTTDFNCELKLTATECMPRYSLLVQTRVHHSNAIDAQRTKGY